MADYFQIVLVHLHHQYVKYNQGLCLLICDLIHQQSDHSTPIIDYLCFQGKYDYLYH